MTMAPITKARLRRNTRDLLKTATFWTAGAVSTMASVYVGLPVDQQQALLAALPVPRWAVPLLLVLLPVAIARVWPQRSLSDPAAPAADAAPVKTQPFER